MSRFQPLLRAIVDRTSLFKNEQPSFATGQATRKLQRPNDYEEENGCQQHRRKIKTHTFSTSGHAVWISERVPAALGR
jgi:hypothetical protein